MSKIIAFISAGSKKQYDYYIKENELNSKEFPYLTKPKQLLTNKNASVIKIGTWYLNSVAKHIKGE